MSDGGFCLACGAFAEEVPASGACAVCSRPVLRRGVRARLDLGGPEADGETRSLPLPPEVQQASQEPKNIFATKYVLLRRIGSGGMGHVWKAWESPLARYVAIKFLKAPSEEDVLRFEREAQLAAALDHPNIIPIYEFGRSEGQYYLVMKFVDGRPLDGADLDAARLVEVMASVCRAVHSAHEAGVIHRDLKPQNIMLSAEGRPIVLDFGLAKTVEGSVDVSVSGMVVGTPSFMPPEQAMGRKELIDRRSDVYSLGATLYAMLARRPPFEAPSPMEVLMKVIHDEVASPRRHNPAVPPLLETIILRALEKDPARRYASAAELADDLERYAAGQTILARPSRRRWIPRIIRRNPFVTAGIVAVLALFAAFARRPAAPGAPSEFLEVRKSLQPPFTTDAARMKELGGLIEAAARSGTGDVMQWLQERHASGDRMLRELEKLKRADWPGRRSEAEELRHWASAMRSLIAPLPDDFRPAREEFADLEKRAALIAGFAGVVALHINIHPYARLDSMTVGGKPFIRDSKVVDPAFGVLSGQESPLAIQELQLDDYLLRFHHPGIGTRELTVSRSTLQAGRKYLIRGGLSPGTALEVRPDP